MSVKVASLVKTRKGPVIVECVIMTALLLAVVMAVIFSLGNAVSQASAAVTSVADTFG